MVANWGTDAVVVMTCEGTLRTFYTEIEACR